MTVTGRDADGATTRGAGTPAAAAGTPTTPTTAGAVTPPATAGPRTAALLERADTLVRALALGTDRWHPGTRSGVEHALGSVRDRLRLGVDHTVVLLAGGTGSGKSSLFNTVSGLPLAEVGVRRPTTSRTTACVWGRSAGPLLDWLEVDPARRTQRESPLDGDAEAALRGMVLLDVPDHDSLQEAHRHLVDRLLPQADLLVWVLDPQKYADDALHSGYLRRLAAHEVAVVVVLNQIDTVPPHARERLLGDATRLLREDGLDVPVLPVSAVTGEGIPALRARLAERVGRAGLAAHRAESLLDEVAERLGAELRPADDEPGAATADGGGGATADDALVDALLAAAGAPAGGTSAAWTPDDLQAESVALARRRWVASRSGGLPAAWAQDLDRRAAPAERLHAAARDALRSAVPARAAVAPGRGTGRVVAGGVLAALGAVALVLGLVLPATAAVVAGAVLLVAGAVLLLVALRGRRGAAAPPATGAPAAARAVLAEVVDVHAGAPARAVLAEHEAVGALVERARAAGTVR
ncbi:ABC transporter [Cellulomonas endophytica]|uniref:ABC transporter n=1 Tax=Cellulomonas endophytica TaxID=2494735 RepID=UPI0013E972E0|nr:ABC transporter [Cellulomonas endophytica]